jgi:hypothetical protein
MGGTPRRGTIGPRGRAGAVTMDLMTIALCAVLAAAATVATPNAWRSLAPGLEVADFASPVPSSHGDSRATVVRVDPAHYEFRLLSAKLLGLRQNLTAPDWVSKYAVTGVINASMYREDHLTSVAFMQSGDKVNNGHWTKDNAVFLAAPRDPSLAAVRIADRSCERASDVDKDYGIVIQNIRMLDCQGRNTWAAQARKWSTACVGIDGAARVLLIHVRSPYSTHDLIDVLRGLPLDLKRLMYVEGGPEASLYVSAQGQEPVSRVGSFETGFRELDDNLSFWPIPNVIAFAPKAR